MFEFNRTRSLGRAAPVLLALAAFPGTVAAESETDLPHLLILPEESEVALPGDRSGEDHGVKVNRGSGFPEPEPETEPNEDVEAVEAAEPDPAPPRRIIRRTRRYGY